MQKLTKWEIGKALAKALHKPVLMLGLPDWDTPGFSYGEIFKAAPYLNTDDLQMLADGLGYIVCDSYEEMQQLYAQTVGDDGPTALNKYDGPMRVYALTINAEGEMENENT